MTKDPIPSANEQQQPQNARYWLGQIWAVLRKMLMFTFAGLGLVLLVRYSGRAAIIIVPILVLLFGTGLYAWLRVKMRKRK